MATTSIPALRLATSILLPRHTLMRTLRIDTKRGIYLSTAYSRKKKREKSSDPPGAKGTSSTSPNNNAQNLEISTQQLQLLQRAAFRDVDVVVHDSDMGLPVRNEGPAREKSPRPAVVKIESLMDFLRVRRDQAARTVLFAPGWFGLGGLVCASGCGFQSPHVNFDGCPSLHRCHVSLWL